MKKIAAIYARVSSEHQKEAGTIASQTALLLEYAKVQELRVPPEWIFEDEGYSGATLAELRKRSPEIKKKIGALETEQQNLNLRVADDPLWCATPMTLSSCAPRDREPSWWNDCGAGSKRGA